jgi:hypothetical protein
MGRTKILYVITLSGALLAAEGQAWKDKPVGEWSEDDTKQILSDSPWAKSVQPEIDRTNNAGRSRRGMGRGGGIGIGGIGIGLPGGGMGRRGGMGYPGGGNPNPNGGSGTDQPQAPPLKLRWESALPIREAELKARETNAPAVDEGHYAVAVYGVPDRMLNQDEKTLSGTLKKEAVIKRDGKKDLKPSSVEVLRREDGNVLLYLFPRSTEISKNDKHLEFNAKIVRLKLSQPFDVEQMNYRGKLEL